MTMDRILLGNIVRDRRRGHTGMVVERRVYFSPYSVHFLVEPQPVDGITTELFVWMAQSRLEVIGKGTGLVGPHVCDSCGNVWDS